MSMAEAAVVGDVFAELGAIVGGGQARRGLAVWPFSRGNSWGYGTKNAVAPGAVVMVLERMNRILEVNEELAYAVIEPGVTQQQLYEHLQANHPSLIADCTDSTPLGSVLGNAVERGYGYTPYGDHFGHLCGLEVVTPSGEVLRTGGAGEGCPTWNTHKWGSGPALEGLFSQGNLGVVIKAGIWLHPRPEQMLLFTIDIDDGPELAAAVDALHTLSLAGALRSHVHTANAFQTLSLVQKYPADLQARGTRIPDAQLAEMKAQYGVPDWTAVGGLYGSPAQVRAARRELERALRGKGRVAFFDAAKVAQSKKLAGPRAGRPGRKGRQVARHAQGLRAGRAAARDVRRAAGPADLVGAAVGLLQEPAAARAAQPGPCSRRLRADVAGHRGADDRGAGAQGAGAGRAAVHAVRLQHVGLPDDDERAHAVLPARDLLRPGERCRA
jgi:FAD/FMN-containing dehydrogenase